MGGIDVAGLRGGSDLAPALEPNLSPECHRVDLGVRLGTDETSLCYRPAIA